MKISIHLGFSHENKWTIAFPPRCGVGEFYPFPECSLALLVVLKKEKKEKKKRKSELDFDTPNKSNTNSSFPPFYWY
jgi:hypothetical protein